MKGWLLSWLTATIVLIDFPQHLHLWTLALIFSYYRILSHCPNSYTHLIATTLLLASQTERDSSPTNSPHQPSSGLMEAGNLPCALNYKQQLILFLIYFRKRQMKLSLIKLKKDWNQLEFFSSLGRLMKLFLINRWNIPFSALGMSEILRKQLSTRPQRVDTTSFI